MFCCCIIRLDATEKHMVYIVADLCHICECDITIICPRFKIQETSARSQLCSVADCASLDSLVAHLLEIHISCSYCHLSCLDGKRGTLKQESCAEQ